jgi:hypothetical protein
VATFLDMQTRIADELDRSDLTAQIKRSIVSAVRHYERRNFYFTEASFTFDTVAGQRSYASSDIANSPSIDILNGDFYGMRVVLTKQPFEDLDRRTALLTFKAMPEEWAYYGSQVWLYPIPDRAYTMTAYSVPRLTELSADSDSNAWTNDAEELIRTRAKIDLLRNVIRVDAGEDIALLAGQEEAAFVALVNEGASRRATGYSRPTQF